MKTLLQLVILPISFMLLQSSCNRPADYPDPVYPPANADEQRYKHDFYSSYAECRQRNPNPEISCSETISLNLNGQVDVLLGGGDIIVRSTYTQLNNLIIIKATGGLPKEIVFTILSSNELMRNSDGTKWQRY